MRCKDVDYKSGQTLNSDVGGTNQANGQDRPVVHASALCRDDRRLVYLLHRLTEHFAKAKSRAVCYDAALLLFLGQLIRSESLSTTAGRSGFQARRRG